MDKRMNEVIDEFKSKSEFYTDVRNYIVEIHMSVIKT